MANTLKDIIRDSIKESIVSREDANLDIKDIEYITNMVCYRISEFIFNQTN